MIHNILLNLSTSCQRHHLELLMVKIIFVSFVSSEQTGIPNIGELRYIK